MEKLISINGTMGAGKCTVKRTAFKYILMVAGAGTRIVLR